MSTTTYLYILIFPQKNIIKIGKANDIHNRIGTLKRWWGEVNYKDSYSLPMEIRFVHKLEKALHLLLSSYSIEFLEGDGKTEIFSAEALDTALAYINLYVKESCHTGPLQKGISAPIETSNPPLQAQKKWKKTRQGVHHYFQWLSECAARFEKINRLILLLTRYDSRIRYQYDIVGGYIYFRTRGIPSYGKQIMSLLCFPYVDIATGSSGGINCCTCVIEDHDTAIVQYNIALDKTNDPYIDYLFKQTERILYLLPKRSIAAKEEIPVIETKAVMNEILCDVENS